MRCGAVLALGLALVIASSAPAQADHTELVGEITAIDLAAQQIVVEGQTVQIDGKTYIHMRGEEITIADLEVGMTVKVKGPLKGEVLYARRIAVKFC